jgi:hypothetical protein
MKQQGSPCIKALKKQTSSGENSCNAMRAKEASGYTEVE